MAWQDHEDLRDARDKQENQMGHYDQVSAGATTLRAGPNYNKADEAPQAGDVRVDARGEFEAYVEGLGWIPACETQYSIGLWQTKTFGPLRSFTTQSIRANLEMGELLRASEALDRFTQESPRTLSAQQTRQHSELSAAVVEETIDVMIVLMGNLCALGVDMKTEWTRKMQVNRKRKWVVSGDGTGHHVR